jgi:hypothetical protein
MVLLGALAAPCAHAATIEVGRPAGPPDAVLGALAGPVPAGGAVAYASGRPDAVRPIVVQAPGGTARVVGTISPVKDSRVVLAASSGALVATRQASDCSDAYDCRSGPNVVNDELYAGPLGGPLTMSNSCTSQTCVANQPCVAYTDDQQSASTAIAASGSRILVRRLCGGRALVIGPDGVHDLGAVDAAALGADTAAVVLRPVPVGQQVVRVQRLDGTILATYPLPYITYVSPSSVVSPLAVDGETALLGGGGGVRIFDAQAPAGGRLVPGTPATTLIGAGAGRFAVRRAGATAPDALLVFDDGGALLADVRVADRIGAVGFDGTTLTYAQRACVVTTITTWRVGGPPPGAAPRACGTPRPVRTRPVLRSGALSLSVRCPAAAVAGCQGELTATTQRAGRLPAGANAAERLYRLGSATVALNPGETGALRLRPAAGARRFARRHARGLRVVVELRARAGADRPAGDHGVARAQLPLRVVG